MQMMGRELHDPDGREGGDIGSTCPGLDLLPLRTSFTATKALRQRSSTAAWPASPSHEALVLEGFELHRGSTSVLDDCAPLCSDPGLGWISHGGDQGGVVMGTYLHGIFERGPWRRRWLNLLRQRKGLAPLRENQPHHSRQREALLERLADAFEAHVNLEPLLKGA